MSSTSQAVKDSRVVNASTGDEVSHSNKARWEDVTRGLAGGAGLLGALMLLSTCGDEPAPPLEISGIDLSAASIEDSAAVGSAARRTLTVEVSGEDAADVSWSVLRANDSAWLLLSATSGSTPSSLTVSLDPAGLDVGVYRDTLVFELSSVDPVRLPVTFEIFPCRATPLASGANITDSLTTSDCSAAHRDGQFARLYSFSVDAGDSLSVFLTSTEFDGYLVLDSVADASVPSIAEADGCNGVAGDPCVIYALFTDAAQYFLEATSADLGEVGSFSLQLTSPRAPDDPTDLNQYLADSVTAVATGASVEQPSMVFAGAVADLDPTDQVRLEIEAQPTGTALTGNPTNSGESATSGSNVFVAVEGLTDDTDYRWQARTVDQTGRVSDWVAYGDNGEAEPDFSVALPNSGLAFTQQPTDVQADETITPAVLVIARGPSGQTDMNFSGSVTISITNGTGAADAVLTGTLNVLAQNGIAEFSDLNIQRAATGYTLDASTVGLLTVVSESFDVLPGAVSASRSGISVSALSITTEQTVAIEVTALDAYDNPIEGATVVLAATGSGNTLTQPAATTDENGVATGTVSSTDAGVKTVSATIDGVELDQSVDITVAPATPDWDHAPSYIDPVTAAGNAHYNSGGRRIVRISGTTIALVNDGTREKLYRTADNGQSWTLIDDEPGFSSTLVSGPGNLVYHFTRHGGDLRMVRFAYDAATLPAPVVIGSGVDNGSNHGAYAMVNATVNEAGDLFVFWHHDVGGADGYDAIQMIRSTDGGDNWSSPITVRSGATGDSWGYVHSDVTPDGDLVIVYAEWGKETNQFGVSSDDGDTWSHMAISANGETMNPCILPVGNDELYIFAQHYDLGGLVFRKSTNSGASWSAWTSIQANALMGYADPSPALGDDGTIYVAFRGLDTPTQYSDDLRAYVAMSTDGGAAWTFPDNHLSGGRVGTRSTMRYQTWHNYGGPLEWTWLEEDGDDTGVYPTMYDINAGVQIHSLAN